jgi:xylulokinase
MYSLGIDLGSSSIKTAVFDVDSGRILGRTGFPEEEMEILAVKPGWAEQSPELWWDYTCMAIRKVISENRIDANLIGAIGITYQMHGLVVVDKANKPLRNAIIWCDSRAIEIGDKAFHEIGQDYCLQHFLNSPGNFTASKLRWIFENEPQVFRQIHKIMLPGDFIAMKLSGKIATTETGLSEGIFWDFIHNVCSKKILEYYDIPQNYIADVVPVFGVQAALSKDAAGILGLRPGIPISYRAGDQPNNAFSLDVLNPGEVAATAGTSGVVYGVTDKLVYDKQSRINQFLHVNHTEENPRHGMLLCINGTGILISWMKKNFGSDKSYNGINDIAAQAPAGSDGLSIIPFGNGAERMLANKSTSGNIFGLQFNRHSSAHVFRAAQEGIAFSFAYGMSIMKELGVGLATIRAGHANLFLSPIFTYTLAQITGAKIELYNTDGAEGAARGAAYGAGMFDSLAGAFQSLNIVSTVQQVEAEKNKIEEAYQLWLSCLNKVL